MVTHGTSYRAAKQVRFRVTTPFVQPFLWLVRSFYQNNHPKDQGMRPGEGDKENSLGFSASESDNGRRQLNDFPAISAPPVNYRRRRRGNAMTTAAEVAVAAVGWQQRHRVSCG